MKLPDFVYVKAVWEAVSYILAGVLALLVALGKLDPQWALGAGVILGWILGLLQIFDINPQLRAFRAARAARLLAEKKAKKSK